MRAAIVLAAGRSQRFGRTNKMLARYRGEPLVAHALRHALRSPVGRVLVVTGDPRVKNVVRRGGGYRIRIVEPAYSSATTRDSLLAGLQQLRRHEREALAFLGDMPWIPEGIACRLLAARRKAVGAVRPLFRGAPGHPVLLCDIEDARSRLLSGKPPLRASSLVRIAGSPGVIRDVDRPSDLARHG